MKRKARDAFFLLYALLLLDADATKSPHIIVIVADDLVMQIFFDWF